MTRFRRPSGALEWAAIVSTVVVAGWAVVGAISLVQDSKARYGAGIGLGFAFAVLGCLTSLAAVWIVAVVVWAWQGYRRPLYPNTPNDQRD